jgi:NAD(P)-dependent dehydrogenase (short-subunit alcohol dehydrogenase family)
MENRKVALVTGCSTGIGYETALLLARRGYRVFAALRNMEKAGPLRGESRGLPLEILPMDVDRASSVKKTTAWILKKAGRIDVLVNNAGWGAFGPLEEFTDGEILAQYQTNLFGLLRVTRAVLPAMRSRGGGRILHIGSLAGKMTFAGIGLYCSTKHAVEAVTESLRLEVRPFNIEVAVVEPGNIRTPFKANRRKAGVFREGRSAYQGVMERVLYLGDHPSPSVPGPRKVAETVARALRARRMALRYPVGRDATAYPFLRRFLPDALFDRILERTYARFRERPPGKKGSTPPSPPIVPKNTEDRPPVALVTGANSGLGLACTRALAQKGWRVYAGYRNPRKAGHLWESAGRWSVFPLLLDVDKAPSVERAVRRMLKKEGRIDLLLNNAGFVMAGCWGDLTDADIRAQFETNVFGLLRTTRAVLPAMRARGSGRILNVGSVAGFISMPVLGAYSASKFAVNSITEALRMEVREWGVEVSELNPGEIQTQVVQNARLGREAASPRSPYRSVMLGTEAWQRKRFQRAAPVEVFVRAVLQALEDGKMKRRYLVKGEDRLIYALRRLLPDAVWEWGLGRMLPWSRFPRG